MFSKQSINEFRCAVEEHAQIEIFRQEQLVRTSVSARRYSYEEYKTRKKLLHYKCSCGNDKGYEVPGGKNFYGAVSSQQKMKLVLIIELQNPLHGNVLASFYGRFFFTVGQN